VRRPAGGRGHPMGRSGGGNKAVGGVEEVAERPVPLEIRPRSRNVRSHSIGTGIPVICLRTWLWRPTRARRWLGHLEHSQNAQSRTPVTRSRGNERHDKPKSLQQRSATLACAARGSGTARTAEQSPFGAARAHNSRKRACPACLELTRLQPRRTITRPLRGLHIASHWRQSCVLGQAVSA
jgi:hypothetical protein